MDENLIKKEAVSEGSKMCENRGGLFVCGEWILEDFGGFEFTLQNSML